MLPLLVDAAAAAPGSAEDLRQMMAMGAPPGSVDSTRTADAMQSATATRRPEQFFGHAPSEAVNFRLNLLRKGNLADDALAAIDVPTLLICSGKDRIFPSMTEGVPTTVLLGNSVQSQSVLSDFLAFIQVMRRPCRVYTFVRTLLQDASALCAGTRLQKLLPNATRYVLPHSSHTPMLETGISLVHILKRAGVCNGVTQAAEIVNNRQQNGDRAVAGLHANGVACNEQAQALEGARGAGKPAAVSMPSLPPAPQSSSGSHDSHTHNSVNANGSAFNGNGSGGSSISHEVHRVNNGNGAADTYGTALYSTNGGGSTQLAMSAERQHGALVHTTLLIMPDAHSRFQGVSMLDEGC